MKPKRILSMGAGVQSTTLLRMMIRGEIERPEHVVFSDTGWEPPAVYNHLQQVRKEAESAGIPFHVVNNGNIRNDALDPTKRSASMPLFLKKPSGEIVIANRQCTAEYKLQPLIRKQAELVGLQPRQRSSDHLVTTIIGISWDESQRMKDPSRKWIRHEYPLVDLRLTRHDCIRWNVDHGFTVPPRSSCVGCPFHSNAEWRTVRDDPKAWQSAVEFDRKLREGHFVKLFAPSTAFLHREGKPLSEVDIRSEEERGQMTLFDLECEGMCGN